MKEDCVHEWGEEVDMCRNCEGTDLGLVAIEDEPAVAGQLRVKTEPLYGEYCFTCEEFTMVSEARHCELCGVVECLTTMDEEIFGG